ncbi:sugar transferase [Shinella sp.]|uniref:sugar transferase n=1 Tax=Shinella sp. TaxID=1870904 RepID=UPI002896F752|nr:sugar transferase [Shinella sp.]
MFLKRTFDIALGLLALAFLIIPMAAIALAVLATSRGPALYWSQRVGRGNSLFWMPKFRTMRIDTPVVATHLLEDPTRHLTPIGSFLRKTSLDELPQLWCILRGDMSVVGPRPALFNQDDLIAARTAKNVQSLPPGLTGWAQINGRDELAIPEKVALDAEYLKRRSFLFDLRIMAMTVIRVVGAAGIQH